MKSNYKPIGDFIRLVDKRNRDLKVSTLLGLTVNKEFIPSVANTVGTNMANYKIIKKNQFACSLMQVRRDKKIPVAILSEFDEAIISQAYPVFEIIDEEKILQEYLMMWFSRSEFDSESCFYAVGGVRGSLEWEDFCNMQLPVPSIEKQKAIVKEYNTIANRIKLNEELNKKLEETAQAIYKQWFVDFEFPNENRKPYKSSGGKMVWCEELGMEIPEGWRSGRLEDIADIIDGDRGINYPSQNDFFEEEYCLFLNAGNVTKIGFNFTNTSYIKKEKDELLRKGKLKRQDIVLTTRGSVGNIAFYSSKIDYENIRINSGMVIFRTKESRKVFYLYSLMTSSFMKNNIANYMSGSAQPQLPIRDINKIPILIVSSTTVDFFSEIYQPVQENIDIQNKENQNLIMVKDLILSKMTKV